MSGSAKLDQHRDETMPMPTGTNKVLLIGWDAADWKVIHPLMDAGRMPNLQRLVDQGAMGQIATLHPPLSPMLWTSIATGKRPFQHGIHGFVEPTCDGLSLQPVSNLSRKCKAVWNILNQNGLKSIVIGWWPSHPAEPINGVTVSDLYHKAQGPIDRGWPLPAACVHPARLHEQLADLRFHPDDITEEMIAPFIPRYREIDQDKDRRLAGCMRTLSECVSIHSAATWLLANEPWDFFAVYYDAIDHFCHGFMRYHPPRQMHIPERDFELYKNVVTQAYLFHDMMLGTLLQKVDDDVTVILMSDHGFHPDHLRPRTIPNLPAGPAIEHRDFGILAIKGPNIKRDELLHGPSVLDITPTILTLYGLPIGEDMDGKVLVNSFARPPEIKSIASWEEIPGEDGRHPPHTQLDPVGARESLEQLVALGYIAPPSEDRAKAVADAIAELRYNLGEAYQDADRHFEAVEIFRELHRANPDEQRYAVHRFLSAQALGLVDEMREIVADLDGRRRELFEQARGRLKEMAELLKNRRELNRLLNGDGAAAAAAPGDDKPSAADPPAAAVAPIDEAEARTLLSPEERKEQLHWQNLIRFEPAVIDYLKAHLKTRERRYDEALGLLDRVQESHLTRPGLFLQAAELYMKLDRWGDAQETYAKALAIDPDNPHAHVGMARLALRRRDFDTAAESALLALERLYHYPRAHFLLGVALTGMAYYERAATAYQTALSINPNFPQAHLRLAWLMRRQLGDPIAADRHFRQYRELRRGGQPASGEIVSTPASPHLVRNPPVERTATADGEVELLGPLENEVVIVSGLPRSGTSMLMQVLTAGGLDALTDGRRAADEDNPRGYFEYEPVKHLHQDSGWLAQARGKVVKIVAPLLPFLPPIDCRVVFIDRDLDEVIASQAKMLARQSGESKATPDRRSRLEEQYRRLVHQIKNDFSTRPRTRLLVVEHSQVLADPPGFARKLDRFLGGGLDVSAMVAAVKPSLHRQRASVALTS